MDDLVDTLSHSFQVTKSTNNIYTRHPRFDKYKQKSSKDGDQNVRRENSLKQQKKNRFDFLSHVRCLADGEWDVGENLEDDGREGDDMEVTEVKLRPPKRYKDQLMLSEWLVEVPGDFNEDWLMLICPRGRRNLVVAAKGRTRCYSKSGYCIDTFASALPGGSHATNSGYTILDCIYSSVDQAFYVLDLMCWNNHPVYDCETEFRLFWLQSKLQETDFLTRIYKNNSYKFIGLSSYACNKDCILSALESSQPNNVDGLLFYHKRTHYTFGGTPLVTWLKVPMIKDILDITPPQAFLDETCDNKMTEG